MTTKKTMKIIKDYSYKNKRLKDYPIGTEFICVVNDGRESMYVYVLSDHFSSDGKTMAGILSLVNKCDDYGSSYRDTSRVWDGKSMYYIPVECFTEEFRFHAMLSGANDWYDFNKEIRDAAFG